jgi:hypothetical protein
MLQAVPFALQAYIHKASQQTFNRNFLPKKEIKFSTEIIGSTCSKVAHPEPSSTGLLSLLCFNGLWSNSNLGNCVQMTRVEGMWEV